MKKILAILILLLFTQCSTPEVKKSEPERMITLANWGKIIFVNDIADRDGQGVVGLYTMLNGEHVVLLSRKSHNLEKIFIHEALHAQGFKHNTKEERDEFLRQMQTYGYTTINDD